MFDHRDLLSELDENLPLVDKLQRVHELVRQRFNFVDRIAIALYESETDELKTFIASSGGKPLLTHYSAPMSQAESLQEIIASGRPRIIDDLSVFASSSDTHSIKIAEDGYNSSYTVPTYNDGNFSGFVFFNSRAKSAFNDGNQLNQLDVYAHLIAYMAINKVAVIRTLANGINMARMMTQYRDRETSAHLERMAQYTKIIAKEMADKHALDDEFVEFVFLAAPLHDVGKIAIPDEILLKPGPLTEAEMEIMRSHVRQGREIVEIIIENFAITVAKYANILRNVAEYHHEAIDGSGYPDGLRGEEIPLEARMVAVADIFDALTSQRPYKQAWSNAEAFALLMRQAGETLDTDAVAALISNETALLTVQSRFREDKFG